MKVLAACDNCCDIYLDLNRFYPTGNGIDFAVNLKKLGGDVSVLTLFGNDGFALSVRKLLDRHGIDCARSRTVDVPSAEAIMDLVGGDRVHLKFTCNAMDHIRFTEEDFAFIRTFDLVYTEKRTNPWDYAPKVKTDHNIRIHDFSARFRPEQYDRLLPYLDCAFFSLPGSGPETEDFLRACHKKGARTVVGMLGKDGSAAYDGGRFYRMPAKAVEIVNTVGAGDAYIAGFAGALIKGGNLPACMEAGRDLATEIIGRFEPY